MSTEPKMSFKPGSKVWVWDSMRLPAVVVHRAQMDRVLVRVEHGLTFTAATQTLCRATLLANRCGRCSYDQSCTRAGHSHFKSNSKATEEVSISAWTRGRPLRPSAVEPAPRPCLPSYPQSRD